MIESKTFHALVVLGCMVAAAQGVPHNTAILDGRPTEYTADELVGSNGLGEGGTFGVGNALTNLYVTWDDTYLYIALQGWEADNKLAVLLDVDPGAGTGATTTTNWATIQPSHIMFNGLGWEASDSAVFGADYMFASEGFFNDVLRITYDGVDTPDTNNVAALFTEGNGATPRGSPIDMVVQADDTECILKGLEARIPWSELYTADDRFGVVAPGEVVPQGATIRLFANLHNNDPAAAFSSDLVIPDTVNQLHGAGLLTTVDYIDVLIDSTDDGMPDNLSMGSNPPFLRDVLGKAEGDIVYARFNKDVTQATATNTANWTVNGLNPLSITNPTPDTVFLFLADTLPTSGVVNVVADGVEDVDTNTRETSLCLFPSADGLDAPLTVRFVLDTGWGMGPSGSDPAHGASAFFLNGDSPLEWGFPPATSTPVDQSGLGGDLLYTDVILPPGTPLSLSYKFSALLDATGTNNYEVVRLADYADAARVLTLDTNALGGVMFVTNQLGAAGAPLRPSGDEDAYVELYEDSRRGDAGVDQRIVLDFELDLSGFDMANAQRVMVQGTDPLRGFNWDGTQADWLGGPPVPNNIDFAGIELTNNGSGIFTATWSMTEDGTDPIIVPDSFGISSLVGGGFENEIPPYAATWLDGRTPRSFKYQFYVVNEWGDVLASPGSDIEVYVEPGPDTNLLLSAAWEGVAPDEAQDPDQLPDTTNAPTTVAVARTGDALSLSYTNVQGQLLHTVDVTSDLGAGWNNYGQVASFNSSGVQDVPVLDDEVLFVRMRGARPTPYQGAQWSPNPVPETGGVARIYFSQHGANLAGNRNVQIAGTFTGWAPEPATFVGDGVWYYDLSIDEADPDSFQFKFRDLAGANWWGPEGTGGKDFSLYKGPSSASWTPAVPTNGGLLTITYDADTGPFPAATNVFAHVGFDEPWFDTASRTMTNVSANLWEVALTVPTNVTTSVNFVFNNGAGTWHSESDNGGREWRAFVGPLIGDPE